LLERGAFPSVCNRSAKSSNPDVVDELWDQTAACVGGGPLRGRLQLDLSPRETQDHIARLLEDLIIHDRGGHEIAQIVELHALAIQEVIHSLVGSGQKVAVDIQRRSGMDGRDALVRPAELSARGPLGVPERGAGRSAIRPGCCHVAVNPAIGFAGQARKCLKLLEPTGGLEPPTC